MPRANPRRQTEPGLLDLLAELADVDPDQIAAMLDDAHVPWVLDRRDERWRPFDRVADPLGYLS